MVDSLVVWDKIMELGKLLNKEFIVCLETSASLHGLCNTSGYPVRIYATKEINLPDVKVEVIESIGVYKDKLHKVDGYLFTNVETTIMEMLKKDGDPQTINESLCFYYYSVQAESWGILPKLAEEYGVLDYFNSFKEDAIEHAFY